MSLSDRTSGREWLEREPETEALDEAIIHVRDRRLIDCLEEVLAGAPADKPQAHRDRLRSAAHTCRAPTSDGKQPFSRYRERLDGCPAVTR
ncbi:hypothetical protein [Breoghania sp.]|uniref:hypothetical protein n=1 Tax=Breoghania sp. TaxID=2065378 RepID=UPI00260A260D|nr:hypothetical protein [Breoghania sp.]